MLNIFKEKLKLPKQKINTQKKIIVKTSKHFPSPIREWTNSIYLFNKNNLKLIPCTTKLVTNIIKSYFNLYNKRLEYKLRAKLLSIRLRKLSSNKFYVSNGGFKHTNNKLFVNLYVFNRQKANNLTILRDWYLKTFLNNSIKFNKANIMLRSDRNNNLNIKLVNRLKIIKDKGIQTAILLTKNKYLLIKGLNTVNLNKNYNISNIKNFSNYTRNFYLNLIQKSLKKIRVYFYYKQLLYLNRSKLNYTYLQYLKKYLEKIYSKNIEFNIINLKKFYLNSDILSESITLKLTKNRRKLLRFIKSLTRKVNVEKKKVFSGYFDGQDRSKNLSNIVNSKQKLILQKDIMKNLKYKDITGFRLETKGRLTRRFTAERSVYKQTHKGGIYDIDSSFRNLSSVLLKGNLKSNTQYTYLKSKTRIGSFGIKGWVSGN